MFKTMLSVLYSDLNLLQVIYNAFTGHDSYIIKHHRLLQT